MKKKITKKKELTLEEYLEQLLPQAKTPAEKSEILAIFTRYQD